MQILRFNREWGGIDGRMRNADHNLVATPPLHGGVERKQFRFSCQHPSVPGVFDRGLGSAPACCVVAAAVPVVAVRGGGLDQRHAPGCDT